MPPGKTALTSLTSGRQSPSTQSAPSPHPSHTEWPARNTLRRSCADGVDGPGGSKPALRLVQRHRRKYKRPKERTEYRRWDKTSWCLQKVSVPDRHTNSITSDRGDRFPHRSSIPVTLCSDPDDLRSISLFPVPQTSLPAEPQSRSPTPQPYHPTESSPQIPNRIPSPYDAAYRRFRHAARHSQKTSSTRRSIFSTYPPAIDARSTTPLRPVKSALSRQPTTKCQIRHPIPIRRNLHTDAALRGSPTQPDARQRILPKQESTFHARTHPNCAPQSSRRRSRRPGETPSSGTAPQSAR
jgi:hypothetical protein